MDQDHDAPHPLIASALQALGVRRLVLAIHDPSFPSDPGEDTGRGAPTTAGGRRFLRFAAALGFNGLQLGPQGELSADNPSPYDGALFARSTLSIALAPLAADGGPFGRLLHPETLHEIVAARPPIPPDRADHRAAYAGQQRALAEVCAAFRRARAASAPPPAIADLAARLEAFRRRHAAWLLPDALYDPLCAQHGHGHFNAWSGPPDLDRRLFAPAPGEEAACAARLRELSAQHAAWIEDHALRQLMAHEQHADLRALAAELGLKLYGDMQIGLPPRDLWARRSLFLRDYRMGAPPSRTNPEGQPWGYPVLDPSQYDGAAGDLARARVEKMLDEFDGVRVDHPHGLVCPWVYRADAQDPLESVQRGARLFSSPDLPDHPELAHYAIATPDQLNRGFPRYADDWVRSLAPVQIDRYAALFDRMVSAARGRGREIADLVCEVLSTLPFPLRCMLDRHGLGRFRVTQKANLRDPADVYRSDNAEPPDWIMVGNHDTPPLWLLLDRWYETGAAAERAAYLAERLAPSPGEASTMAASFAADPALLARACFADLFASPAENVSIFFADLLGFKQIYNRPGVISDDNWSLRIPAGYERAYSEHAARGAALDLPRVLAMALCARGGAGGGDRRALAEQLMALPAPSRPAA